MTQVGTEIGSLHVAVIVKLGGPFTNHINRSQSWIDSGSLRESVHTHLDRSQSSDSFRSIYRSQIGLTEYKLTWQWPQRLLRYWEITNDIGYIVKALIGTKTMPNLNINSPNQWGHQS